jgi:trans-aconitate 2-methyltransferase
MFKWNPEDYAVNSSAQLAWAKALIAQFGLRGDEAVFDVGCGDGKITAEIAGAIPRGYALGVDASPEMIAYAQRLFPRGRYPNLEFRRMDARWIELERPFDLAFSNAALHWIDDQRAVLNAIHRALRPGGRLVISCGGRGNAADILGVLDGMMQTGPWCKCFADFTIPYFFYGPEEYGEWLAEAGFVPSRVELVAKDMVQAGPVGLAAWIRTTWMPFTDQVPPERRESFIGEVVKRYLARHPLDPEGNAHVKMVRLEVDAART